MPAQNLLRDLPRLNFDGPDGEPPELTYVEFEKLVRDEGVERASEIAAVMDAQRFTYLINEHDPQLAYRFWKLLPEARQYPAVVALAVALRGEDLPFQLDIALSTVRGTS